jgi:hypothetical protein
VDKKNSAVNRGGATILFRVGYGLAAKGPETEEAMEKNYEIKNTQKNSCVHVY